MYRTNNVYGNQILTTDLNGDMLLNDANIGSGNGQHPDPGVGPTYFAAMAANNNGKRIWNINWSPDGTQTVPERGFIAHNGEWKELT